MAKGPFQIGAKLWPGISKLVEESGEVGQVLGKLIATGGEAKHWDGTNLIERLEEEIGDVLAAIRFVRARNPLNNDRIDSRRDHKYELFCEWHAEAERAEDPPGPQPTPFVDFKVAYHDDHCPGCERCRCGECPACIAGQPCLERVP